MPHRIKILIVEDHAPTANALAKLLGKGGDLIAGPNTITATVKDNTTGATLGTFAGTNTHA